MAEYRWNLADLAAGYDAAAEHIHPYYLALQDRILDLLPVDPQEPCWIVDAGAGSGRLAGRILERFERAHVVLIDQSPAFFDLAATRLAPYADRVVYLVQRLQDDWQEQLPTTPRAIVSMSAVHHLDAAEKRSFYRRCATSLAAGGVLLNGDEIRAPSDADYLSAMSAWAAHMHRVIEANLVPAPMRDALLAWEQRNVQQFDQPRVSGDDCHETINAQLGYLLTGGFAQADVPWQQAMWALLRGTK